MEPQEGTFAQSNDLLLRNVTYVRLDLDVHAVGSVWIVMNTDLGYLKVIFHYNLAYLWFQARLSSILGARLRHGSYYGDGRRVVIQGEGQSDRIFHLQNMGIFD